MPTGQLKILAIPGSTRTNSVNELLLQRIVELSSPEWEIEIFKGLTDLPYFNRDLDGPNTPLSVDVFRKKIARADGVLICTPEYIFSLPGILKNAIEWTVSTTVFSGKPMALITASGLGEKAHESLLTIFKTIYARVEESCTLLISGVAAKIKNTLEDSDRATIEALEKLVSSFSDLIKEVKAAPPVTG